MANVTFTKINSQSKMAASITSENVITAVYYTGLIETLNILIMEETKQFYLSV